LGLSTVYGIVEQCGGSIKVESKPGVGSIFHLYLPRAVIEINQLEQNLFTPIESGNNETILLVEDEQLVRNLVYNVLNEQGYKVLVAENGREALALANSTQGIDLLLSDIIMPDMNGLEVARRIQEGHPALKVLYMSGYTDKGIIEHRFTDPNFNFLQKPFNPGLLLNKVQEVMGVWRR
jgi:CheY-like chemotaxis protein